MGILASISLPRKMLLAVVMMVFGLGIMSLSLSSTKGKLSPISYPGQDTSKPLAKLMHSQMVPGHPFYPLLMMRDRIELQFISDPVQNAWKRVELANQRVESSRILLDEGETDLGISTLSKAEQYMATAVSSLKQHDPSQLAKVQTVLLEQKQMMTALETNLTDSQKAHMDQVLTFNASILQTISDR